jgi:hypothetical protein
MSSFRKSGSPAPAAQATAEHLGIPTDAHTQWRSRTFISSHVRFCECVLKTMFLCVCIISHLIKGLLRANYRFAVARGQIGVGERGHAIRVGPGSCRVVDDSGGCSCFTRCTPHSQSHSHSCQGSVSFTGFGLLESGRVANGGSLSHATWLHYLWVAISLATTTIAAKRFTREWWPGHSSDLCTRISPLPHLSAYHRISQIVRGHTARICHPSNRSQPSPSEHVQTPTECGHSCCHGRCHGLNHDR